MEEVKNVEESATSQDNVPEQRIQELLNSGQLRLALLLKLAHTRPEERHDLGKDTVLGTYNSLLNHAMMLDKVPHTYISPELRDSINEAVQLVLVFDQRLVADHCFNLGLSFQERGLKKSAKYYLLAHRLGNEQASECLKTYFEKGFITKHDFIVKYHEAFKNNSESDIKKVCAENPDEFRELLLKDFILTPKVREKWLEYFDQRDFRPVAEPTDSPKAERKKEKSLLQTVKGLFFSDSSDDEQEREMVEVSPEKKYEYEQESQNDKNIQNSNINPNPGNPG